MAEPDAPPLRADARRNRRRILAAARPVVTDLGFLVQMDDIAQRAGVSVGTVYRHFPSKDHLVGELVAERFAEFASEMELAWREVGTGRDPFEAMVAGLWRCAELTADDRSLQDSLISAAPGVVPIAKPARDNLHRVAGRLIDAAILSGGLRPDATNLDIDLLMTGLAATQSPRCPATNGPDDWRRYMALAIDSLRAPARA